MGLKVRQVALEQLAQGKTNGLPISGVVLADHARSLDWNSRRAELICQLPAEVVQDVATKIIALVAED